MAKQALLSHTTELGACEAIDNSCLNSKMQDKGKERWQPMEMGIPLHLTALCAGMASSILDDVGLIYENNYPSLSGYINHGFKPLIFALMSARLNSVFFDRSVIEVEERFARFFVYFVMNYLTVMTAQPINKWLAEKIQNKVLNFFVQMFIWTMLWNPSLFLSESSRLFSTLFLQVTQALCFKIGEESYKIGKRLCFPFWSRNNSLAFDIEGALLESEHDNEFCKNKLSL